MTKKEFTKKGSLEVVCGSMFSGKSEELIRRLRRAQLAKLEIVAVKHSLDNRTFIEYVVSHNGTKIKAIPLDNAKDILDCVQPKTHIVGIDEAHFFDNTLIEVVELLIDQGKHVIVAGLDLDFRGEPFGPMPILLSLADRTTKLKAICMECGQDAHFTQRIIGNRPADYSDPVIVVGAQEKYQPRCRNCHIVNNKVKTPTCNV